MTHNATPAAPVRRAYQIYLYAVCFVTVLVALFTAAESAYGLFRVISPETTAAAEFGPIPFAVSEGESPERVLAGAGRSTERKRGTAQLIQMGLIAAAAGLVFRHHQRQATALRAELERSAGGSTPSGSSTVPNDVAPAVPSEPAADVTKPLRRSSTRARPRTPKRKT